MNHVCTLLVVAVLAPATHGAEYWRWSPSQPHHNAAVQVRVGTSFGSGIYVAYGELRGVLSAQHVGSGRTAATVTWSDGTQTAGHRTIDKFSHDLAFIFTRHPSIKPIELAEGEPRAGDRLEVLGFGGPKTNPPLRAFFGDYVAPPENVVSRSHHILDCYVIHGDSGAGVLRGAKLIGIAVSGTAGEGRLGGVPVYKQTCAVRWTPIRNFLARIHTRYCPGGQCQPQPFHTPRENPENYSQLYPPQTRPSQTEPSPAPTQTPGPVDREALKAEITQALEAKLVPAIVGQVADYIAAKPEQFRGPQGKDGARGANGRDGKDVDPQQLAELQRRLAELENAKWEFKIYDASGAEASGWVSAKGGLLRFPVDDVSKFNLKKVETK